MNAEELLDVIRKPERLSPALRARIQARVNGRKGSMPQAVAVKDSGTLFWFWPDWGKKQKRKRRAANKVAKASRKRNRRG